MSSLFHQSSTHQVTHVELVKVPQDMTQLVVHMVSPRHNLRLSLIDKTIQGNYSNLRDSYFNFGNPVFDGM